MPTFFAQSSDGVITHQKLLQADSAEEALGVFLCDAGASFETAKFFEQNGFLCFRGPTDTYCVIKTKDAPKHKK